MMASSRIRVLWLLNHTTLRRFEVAQLRALGITEIYAPKRFPYDEGNLSASVDTELDTTLTIPEHELRILNEQDWYDTPSPEAWAIVNRYFRVAIIGFFPRQIAACVRHFDGAIVLRVFGLSKGYSYSQLIAEELGPPFLERLRRLGSRFWLGIGYEHLREEEDGLLRRRACFLPVGLEGTATPGNWRGNDARVFFVCPRIGTSPYFRAIYQNFCTAFEGLPYVIGGAQPVAVNNPNVLGFVPTAEHERNMRELRVMFYHSTEPNHIHYHPFEAIRAGMPLVYMAGGMLDLLGGESLPGRCPTMADARRKIERILAGDRTLIEAIRESQLALLEQVSPAKCTLPWQRGFTRILDHLPQVTSTANTKTHRPRIAVIVPVAYRGGTLRGAKLLAQAIETGSRQEGKQVEVVLGHLDDDRIYDDEAFHDLPETIRRRPFHWCKLEADEAQRAMAYAGIGSRLEDRAYQVPDDGIRQFSDCDLWIIVSDRLEHPLLPLRPYVLMVYDYLQRYEQFLPQKINLQFVRHAHAADRVLVTTDFTRQDAIQFAGVPAQRVKKLPMLAPTFSRSDASAPAERRRPYFLWTTNLSQHKNHENALRALQIYYEELGGTLECLVSGVGTDTLLSRDLPHLKALSQLVNGSPILKRRLHLLGDLPEWRYQKLLAHAVFLWHPARIDNGTFSVIEAASLGVPSLSSDYPAMHEISMQFRIPLSWMNAHDARNMAQALQRMESAAEQVRQQLPSREAQSSQSLDALAGYYWKALEECL